MGSGGWQKSTLLALAACVVVFGYLQLSDTLCLSNLARHESQLRELQQRNPVLVYGAAFLVYVLVAGFMIPVAPALTLLYGWYFGLIHGVFVVSFSSTAGATLAALLSRYLFRDFVLNRFNNRLDGFNQAFRCEGIYFLFSLRLVPAVPFFVINAAMGLTSIRLRTFWWVSQLGMLPGTALYVYAGSCVPGLPALADKGIHAVFSPRQMTHCLFAFVLLGLVPLILREAMRRISRRACTRSREGWATAVPEHRNH